MEAVLFSFYVSDVSKHGAVAVPLAWIAVESWFKRAQDNYFSGLSVFEISAALMFILFGLSALSLRGSPSTTSCKVTESIWSPLGAAGSEEFDELQWVLCNSGLQLSFVSAAATTTILGQADLNLLVISHKPSGVGPLLPYCSVNLELPSLRVPSVLRPVFFVLFSLLENTLGRFSFVSVSQRIATKACYLHVTLAKPVALEERRLRGFAFCKLWKTVFSVVQRSGKNSDRCKNLHPGL